MMPKEITVGVEFHDHASDIIRGITGMLKNFQDEVHLPPELGSNFVETVSFKGRDAKVHVLILPTTYLLAAIAGAVEHIKRLDGSSIKHRPMPHEAVQEDDEA